MHIKGVYLGSRCKEHPRCNTVPLGNHINQGLGQYNSLREYCALILPPLCFINTVSSYVAYI